MLNFAATINGTTYDDPALFETDALAWRKGKPSRETEKCGGWPGGHLTGNTEGLLKATKRMWRTPARREFAEPTGYAVGAEITLKIDGAMTPAQVWSLAPKSGVWAVDEEGYPWYVDTRDGTVFEGAFADGAPFGQCGVAA